MFNLKMKNTSLEIFNPAHELKVPRGLRVFLEMFIRYRQLIGRRDFSRASSVDGRRIGANFLGAFPSVEHRKRRPSARQCLGSGSSYINLMRG